MQKVIDFNKKVKDNQKENSIPFALADVLEYIYHDKHNREISVDTQELYNSLKEKDNHDGPEIRLSLNDMIQITNQLQDNPMSVKPVKYNRKSIDKITQQLDKGIPVLTTLPIYDSFFNALNSLTGKVFVPFDGEKSKGGHVMTIVGYDKEDEIFLVRNTWGEKWAKECEFGEKTMPGHCKIPYQYIKDYAWDVASFADSEEEYFNKNTIIEKLIEQGINEQDALLITSQFDDLQGAAPADIKSKNIVYHLTDNQGNKKVVKFVTDKKEAEVEALANYHFSKHPVLKNHVASSNMETPLEVIINGNTKYMIVKEDITDKANKNLDKILEQGNKEQHNQYLTYWMKTLAKIHVYGTQIMDNLDCQEKALSLTKEKDEDRISLSGISIDKGLRKELVDKEIENGYEFIHQDIRKENRVGQYAIDWGHAGRGNGFLDIARVLSDYDVQKQTPLTETDYKHFIKQYLQEKKSILGKEPVRKEEIDKAFNEFDAVRLLYYQAQTAYLTSKADDCSPTEAKTGEFMKSQIPEIEKSARKSIHQVSGPVLSYEQGDNLIYFLPKRQEIAA